MREKKLEIVDLSEEEKGRSMVVFWIGFHLWDILEELLRLDCHRTRDSP